MSPDTPEDPKWPDTISKAEALEGKRILKSHLSRELMPETIETQKRGKVVYVARNPRDVCVSFFNHWRILEGFHGDFNTFVDAFLNDTAGYNTPYLSHALEFWKLAKKNDNILFIFYEEMKKDLPSVIRKVSLYPFFIHKLVCI